MAGISLKYVNTYDPNDRLRRQCPEIIEYKAMGKKDVLTNNQTYIINSDTLSEKFTEYNLRRQKNPQMKEFKTEEDYINHIVKALTLSGYFTIVNNTQRKVKEEENNGN